jgi:hypothetical protein
MATYKPATQRQLRYVNDLAVRVNQSISSLMDQYGTYTRVAGIRRLSQADAGALISILQARLTRGHAREKVAGKRQSARDDVLIAWEPSREVKGLQGAIVMDVPVHRVVTKGTVQEGLFRGRRRRTHAETPHRHVHARRR